MAGAKPKFTPKRKEQFLEHYKLNGLINKSAHLVDVDPETVRRHRKGDATFDDAMKTALRDFQDTLETAAYERAVDGIETDIIQKGVVVGTRVEYSDRLLELMLKRHIPAYRDKSQVDMNVGGGVLIVPQGEQSSKDWEAKNKKRGK